MIVNLLLFLYSLCNELNDLILFSLSVFTNNISTLSHLKRVIFDGQCPSYSTYNLERYLGLVYYSFIPMDFIIPPLALVLGSSYSLVCEVKSYLTATCFVLLSWKCLG